MIQEFLNGGMDKAGEMIFANNPLSIICSLVCDHEKQCEGHCILGAKGTPVHISSIENYISETYLDKISSAPEKNKGEKVAIIGSGPAGITIAVILAGRGYNITIFESREQIGGVLRYGIPEFRLPKSILDRYKKKIMEMGIKIRPNTSIGGALTIDDLKRDGYKAIFIGTGVWRPQTLGVKGESLGNVHYAIDYLVNPDTYELGKSIAIIGAGNAAMDVARTALRHGARQVTVFARGNKSAASKREVDYAIADGVEFKYGRYIQEITDQGPIFKKAEMDENGKAISFSHQELFNADTTIISVSQGPKDKLVNTTEGLKASENGLLETSENGETSLGGIFASGDVVKGARTVVEAVKYSKQVADAIDKYIQSL